MKKLLLPLALCCSLTSLAQPGAVTKESDAPTIARERSRLFRWKKSLVAFFAPSSGWNICPEPLPELEAPVVEEPTWGSRPARLNPGPRPTSH